VELSKAVVGAQGTLRSPFFRRATHGPCRSSNPTEAIPTDAWSNGPGQAGSTKVSMAEKADSRQGISKGCIDSPRKDSSQNVVRQSGAIRLCRKCGRNPVPPSNLKVRRYVCSACKHRESGDRKYQVSPKRKVVNARYHSKPSIKEHHKWELRHRYTGKRLAEMSL